MMRLSVLTLILIFVLCFSVGSTAQQSITAERMDAHTVLFTFENRQYMGFDLERSKELKKAENDAASFSQQLQLCKNNEQDHKVRYSNLESLYKDQSVLFQSCMALSKNGSGIMNKYLRFGLDVAPPVITLLKPCH